MTLEEFKRLNKENGLHWFDQGTLKFWASRIPHWDTSGYFISREKSGFGDDRNFMYTIRKANFVTGNVTTVGEFLAYKTLHRAKSALNEILKEGRI